MLIRDRKGHTVTQRRRTCQDGGRDWSDAATAKQCQDPPEAGRGKEGFSPRAAGGSVALPILILDVLPLEV